MLITVLNENRTGRHAWTLFSCLAKNVESCENEVILGGHIDWFPIVTILGHDVGEARVCLVLELLDCGLSDGGVTQKVRDHHLSL